MCSVSQIILWPSSNSEQQFISQDTLNKYRLQLSPTTVGLGDFWALSQPCLLHESLIHIHLPLCLDMNKFLSARKSKNNIDAKNPLVFMLFIPVHFPKEKLKFHRLFPAFYLTFQKIKAKFLLEEFFAFVVLSFREGKYVFSSFKNKEVWKVLVWANSVKNDHQRVFCGWGRLPVAPAGRVKVTGGLQGPSHPAQPEGQ